LAPFCPPIANLKNASFEGREKKGKLEKKGKTEVKSPE
jgi:hypothetical protein